MLKDEQIEKIVDVDVKMSFASAAEVFAERPSATNFTQLSVCMFALQYWKGLMPLERSQMAQTLWSLPIGQWMQILHDKQKADFTSALQPVAAQAPVKAARKT